MSKRGMVLDRFRIDGQVAVITGGTKGLGRTAALSLAEAGADIATVSRTPNKELESAILDLGRRYSHHVADLTRREEIKRVIPAVMASMGDVNILVNNAGICPRAPALEYSEQDWDATLEIDLTATFFLSQAAAKIMMQKCRGKIINIASVLAFQGGINIVAYSAAKHGVAGITKALANDWAKNGINVNAIAPGYIKTELTEPLQDNHERAKYILGRTPAGRWGEPEDIAGSVLFLASSASDFISGAILTVDGGWMAW